MADGETQELRPVHITVHTPGDPEELRARIALADASGLPEAVEPRSCIIVASGPSARSEALWERLWAEHEFPRLAPPTIAVNNALKLFTERGLAPDYWCACDPQDVVLDFLPEYPPERTTYLLASKCHPKLFERLANRNVKLWRVDDYGKIAGKLNTPSAVSVTLVAQSLMRFAGFHRFEMYGWDCCLMDGEHHAHPQKPPDDLIHYSIESEDGQVLGKFETSGSWLAEINDAFVQTYNMRVMGYDVIVHGNGAVAATLKAKGLIQ